MKARTRDRVDDVGSGDLLEAIVGATRARVDTLQHTWPEAEVRRRAAGRRPRCREFSAALARHDRVNVIAECKRRSPVKGVLRWAYDPAAIAQGYVQAGAAAVSVLTEPTFFDGRITHVSEVRAAVTVPVLRKDFIVCEYQLLETRAAGADAVLLIVAALDDGTLRRLVRAAEGLELAALVEVHDERELDCALAAGASIVGVNNRDLRTLEVDVATSTRLIELIPGGITAVAESGLRSLDEVRTLREGGYGAFLIGEALMAAPDPGRALESLLTN